MTCPDCGVEVSDAEAHADLHRRIRRLERLHGLRVEERPVSSQDAREKEEE